MDTPTTDFAEPSLDIAVVGMSGRFPGARNVDEFWRNLKDGVESISVFTEEELKEAGIPADELAHPGYVKAGPILPDDVGLFDAQFFGFSPREAAILDPQQRLFLECSWEALEHAGYDPNRNKGLFGIYGGANVPSYLIFNLFGGRRFVGASSLFEMFISNDKDYVASRVAYKLNLKGPAVSVQTACSTSLVAVHMACQGLLDYQCDVALAGGVSVRVPHKRGYFYEEGMIFSPDGHCRPFDAKAQGTVFGSGAGVVVLKRLQDALDDGDNILAVIKGSAINNDGAMKVGFTAPSSDGQREAILAALAMNNVNPESITSIETHGTGTSLGDPLEIAALTRVFRATTDKKGYCALGAVKSNVGHLDTAAGVAGLIKTILSLQHQWLPPTLHYETANPQIDFPNSPFFVNTKSQPWTTEQLPRRAGVSSFGIGGTNAHLILEEAPPPAESGPARAWQLVPLSAKTDTALETMTSNFVEHLKKNPDAKLADIAYTLQLGRQTFSHRRMLVCQDVSEIIAAVDASDPDRVFSYRQELRERPVAFMFSGQGTQYPDMARELYESEPAFRKQVDLCCEHLRSSLKLDLRELLFPERDGEEAQERLTQTSIAQPSLFVIEYALASLLQSWGIQPKAMVGHSIGEYVAACIAGVMSLEDALDLVAVRGRLMQGLPAGAMLSVALSEKEIIPLLVPGLSIAAINGPLLCVVSGPISDVELCEKNLLAQKVTCRRLHTSHAFHSHMMEPILKTFADAVRKTSLQPPSSPYISSMSGTWITDAQATDPEYWAAQIRNPVRFADAASELLADKNIVLLEIGPGRTLSSLVKQSPAWTPGRLAWPTLPSPDEQNTPMRSLLTTVGRLWLTGVEVDWKLFSAHEKRVRIPLPSYPFERQRYWIDAPTMDGNTGSAETLGAHLHDAGAGGDTLVVSSQHARPNLLSAYVAPRNDVERSITNIWQEELAIAKIGIHDNFFELGGHSLLATQLLSRMNQTSTAKISLPFLLQNPTIGSISDELARLGSEQTEAVSDRGLVPQLITVPADRHQPFPLTEMQQAQWIGRLSSFSQGNVAAHVYFETESLTLDHERLSTAWRRVVERHEMLRTIVMPDGQQQILSDVPPYIVKLLDLSSMDPEQAERDLVQLREQLSHQVRPTDKWPLFEVRVSRLSNRIRIHFSIDLLICDIWSLRLVLRDWRQFYENPKIEMPPLELSFRDYVLADHDLKGSEIYQRSLEYWKERLQALPPAPELPMVKSPASVTQSRFLRRSATFEQAAWSRLKERAAQTGTTPSTVLLAAFSHVLAAWSKSPHFAVNVTVINRLPFHPQVHDIVGEFASFDLLEVNDTPSLTFEEFVRQLQARSWEDLEHRYVSGVRVLRELARLRGQRGGAAMPVVFTSTLVHGEEKDGQPLLSWLGDGVYSISQTPQVWLDHAVFEDAGELQLTWHSIDELFPDGMLDAMFSAYTGFVRRLMDDDKVWHTTAGNWTPPEQLASRDLANATQTPVTPALLHELVGMQAKQQPQHVAVIASGRTLTYEELWRRSQQVAHRLRQEGVTPNQVVAVVMEKGWEQIVAVLGILAAGGAYVAIDAEWPQERAWYVLEHSGALLALTQEKLTAQSNWPQGFARLVVGEQEWEEDTTDTLATIQGAQDLAYILYTSGSTGVPKGVMIDHRGAVNTIVDINRRFGVTPHDRVLALSSLSFDLSVYDIFGTLAAGGTLVIPEAGSSRDPARWCELIQTHNVTVWNSVPALMEMLTEYLAAGKTCLPLRLVLLSGDWIPLSLPQRIRPHTSAAQIISLGGATEASIWSILYPIGELDAQWSSIPYGKPMANQQFHVLNRRLEACPDWVPGDLYIGGIGVAQGYWRDPHKTAASFIHHPRTGERLYRTGDLGRYWPDGTIEFLGRDDFQVKVNGYRIELGEIETVLNAHPQVRTCVVAAVGADRSHKRLVAYVVRADSETDSHDQESESQLFADLRETLATRVPSYMVPADFMLIEAIPLTGNGKVDRNALPDVDRTRSKASQTVVVRNESVDKLATIFATVLGSQHVDMQDNFFDLGGDSIMGIQVTTLAAAQGLHITPQQLFESGTIGDLANVMMSTSGNYPEQGIVTGPVPLVPIQRMLLERSTVAASHAANWAVIETTEAVDLEMLAHAATHVFLHHDALRLSFTQAEFGLAQVNLGKGNGVEILRVDLSAIHADELASSIEVAAENLAAELDIISGPLACLAWVDCGAQSGRLLWIIHSIVANEASWPILVKDLSAAYVQVRQSRDVVLPSKTFSFKQWADRLGEHQISEKLDQELGFWIDSPLLGGVNAIKNVQSEGVASLVFTQSFTEEETRSFVDDVSSTYRADLLEILLAGVAEVFGKWKERREARILVDICLQDREHFDRLDLTRSVGPFSTIFPFSPQLPRTEDLDQTLRSVKEQLRATPTQGIGYGLLRYRGDYDTTPLRSLPDVDVVVAYSGVMPQLESELTPLRLTAFGCVAEHLPDSPGIEIRAHMLQGRLQLRWTYREDMHARETIIALAENLEQALRAFIGHSQALDGNAYSPSDFPLAEVKQDELDALLAALTQTEES
jgi:amino acid adenylation domain-containing protein/non-ribosomal peptide synthase protein (TIGR01720 family)